MTIPTDLTLFYILLSIGALVMTTLVIKKRRAGELPMSKSIIIPAVAGVAIDRPPVKVHHKAVVRTQRVVLRATRKHPRTLTARQIVAHMQTTRRTRGQNYRTGA